MSETTVKETFEYRLLNPSRAKTIFAWVVIYMVVAALDSRVRAVPLIESMWSVFQVALFLAGGVSGFVGVMLAVFVLIVWALGIKPPSRTEDISEGAE